MMHCKIFLVVFLSNLVFSQLSSSLCPLPNTLEVIQGSLIAAVGGDINLQNGRDIQCFSHALSRPFNCTPGIAIAVNDFQSAYSPNLFFSIKAASSQNSDMINFIVRTQWSYTRWTRIRFSFIAQACSQLEAGYYQVDTGSLSGCYQSKDVMATLPLTRQLSGKVEAITFLSGFEIQSVQKNASYLTSYQIQIVKQSVNADGIHILASSTSDTRVQSLFVSFVAYDHRIQNIVAGTYVYEDYVPTRALRFIPSVDVSNNNLALHGFNGFIVNNNRMAFSLDAQLVGNNVTFSTHSNFYYLTYSYLFLVGGQCGQCRGHTIHFNGQCHASCPLNTHFNGVTCITCEATHRWNGTACVNPCSNGQVWNNVAQICACPFPSNWNGIRCVSCSNGQFWSNIRLACECAAGTNWNGFVCIACRSGQIWHQNTMRCDCPTGMSWNGLNCITCPNGQVWSSAVRQCACPQGTNWSGSNCIRCSTGFIWSQQLNSCTCPQGHVFFQGQCALVPTCRNDQILDTNTNTCVCEARSNWNGFICVTCTHGQIWNPNTLGCVCPQSFNWNGYSCVTCEAGQVWNPRNRACSCPVNHNWNGFACIQCDGGRFWSSAVNNCQCSNGRQWSGTLCITCDPGSNWNGFSCVRCQPTQVWNEAATSCQCPLGMQWNGQACITPCPAGMVNMNGLCSCQAGFYELNGRCEPRPNCPSGQTWNGLQCTAISCPPGTFWNGTVCASQATSNCPAGTFWDGFRCITNTTSCPAGTTWNGQNCLSIDRCPAGTYLLQNSCVPISQWCPGDLVWRNNSCQVTTTCPPGTYANGRFCLPLQPCTDGRVWNSTVSQCVCPSGTFWNDRTCFRCSGGQIFQANVGCVCPAGTFLSGSQCQPVPFNRCSSIANSLWNGSACVCNEGYSIIGMQCACEGLAVSRTFCDRCFQKPNSTWINGICQCDRGLSDVAGRCIVPTTPPVQNRAVCNVATFFDSQQRRCLPCSSGCLACTSCYNCTSCQPGFYMDFATSLCVQVCGDSRRFTLGCDDGNNIDGDGCSKDCKVEVGSTCVGGSPNSRDICSRTIPRALQIVSTGQSRLFGKIILNVRLNYLPLPLIESATDCHNKCNNILTVRIVSGDSSATSILAQYIPGSSFSFSIQIDFQKESFGLFTAQIGINPNLVQKYFSGIDVSRRATVNVNPAFMALVTSRRSDNQDILA